MICPLCNSKLQSVIDVPGIRPQYCQHCDRIWIGDDEIVHQQDFEYETVKTENRSKEEIPKLTIGTVIYVANKEHKFFLEIGTVIEKDHKHYRVRFDSQNKEINQMCLWLPDHWVLAMPSEMVR
jgi:Zn-finger nucleic acid-binding protein